MPKLITLEIGAKFGRLTIAGPRIKGKNAAQYPCRCECSNVKLIRYQKLVEGNTTSCGCLRKEVMRERAVARNTKHGQAPRSGYSPEWKSWDQMMRRCRPDHKSHANYADRGITIAPELQTFEGFFKEVGMMPHPGMEIDRKDNEKGYELGNLQWATDEMQANNRRNNVRLTFNGKTQTIAQWSRETGITRPAIQYRVKQGWSTERILTEPVANGPHNW